MGLHIGKLVGDRMEELGMTQTKLAERTGIPRRTIIRWLHEPNWDTLSIELVSDVLEMNIYEKLARDYAERRNTSLSIASEPPAEYKRRTIKLTVEMDDDADNRQRVAQLTADLSGSQSISRTEQDVKPAKKK